MFHPHHSPSAAVRALFVIDPQAKVRAMLHYPVTVGRSVNEVLRLVQALQTADRLGVVTPEGWTPGEETVELPPDTAGGTDARRGERGGSAYGCVDWYYYKRPASEEGGSPRR